MNAFEIEVDRISCSHWGMFASDDDGYIPFESPGVFGKDRKPMTREEARQIVDRVNKTRSRKVQPHVSEAINRLLESRASVNSLPDNAQQQDGQARDFPWTPVYSVFGEGIAYGKDDPIFQKLKFPRID